MLGTFFEPLETRDYLSGVTLITHGMMADASHWVAGMAAAIAQRADLSNNDFTIYTMRVTDPNHAGSALSVTINRNSGPLPTAASKSPEILLLLDWSDMAGSILGGYSRPTPDVAYAVANALTSTSFLADLGGKALADLPLHLLGHSRGASLVSQIAAQLARRGVWVDQLTTFDPVPISLYGDPVAYTPTNVGFFDNYYQFSDSIAIGAPIGGAYNTGPLNIGGAYVNFLGTGYHDNVHLYYHGTIDASAGANDGSEGVPSGWYSSQSQRTTTGYYWSRLVGGPRPGGGLGAIYGGGASRTGVTLDLPAWANVGQIAVTSAAAVNTGTTLTANFRYQDADSGATIHWFLDTDRNPFNGNEVALADTALAANSSAQTGQLSALLPLVPTGTYYLLGQIADGTNIRMDYAPTALSITNAMPAWIDQFTAAAAYGWIYDPKMGSSPATLRVDIDGVTVATKPADVQRNDLLAPFGSANHGFYYVLPRMTAGAHTVALYGVGTSGTVLLASKVVNSIGLLFDENYYLQTNTDVAAAVAAGALPSGAYHFQQWGQYEHRSPSALFDDGYYLARNADVAAAVSAHSIPSAYWHFVNYGMREGRAPNPYFSETQYRYLHPDVAAAIQAGQYASGFEQYLRVGEAQGLQPSVFFDPAYYNARNADVVAAVNASYFRSSFEHFLRDGVIQQRAAIAAFDPTYYLTAYADVAAAVSNRFLVSAYDHYVRWGQFEKRNPAASFNEQNYLTRYADVAAAVAAHYFESGYVHYLLFGQAEGRVGA